MWEDDDYFPDDSWNIYAPTETLMGYDRYSPSALPFYATNVSGTQTIVFSSLLAPTIDFVSSDQNSITVNVGGVANASGYTVQYSTSASFTNPKYQPVSAGSSPIDDLSVNTKYYFRVKANGSANYNDSDFSAVESVTTEAGSGLDVSVEGKKVTVMWTDANPTADSVRYRAVGTTQWKTQKLREGVTMYSFSGTLGTNYEIEVLLDQQEANVLNATSVVLDQPKLSVDKNATRDDTFTVNVTNYTAKNLATNATQALVTVNGVQTAVDIQNQYGTAALAGGGNVTFNDGQFTFTEMASNTSYKVQVSFAADGSVSTPSSALTVKTLKTCYEAPAITSATAISDTAVTVTWSTAYGKNSAVPAQAYTVQYSLDGVKWTNATTKATGNSFTIQRLKPNTKYLVSVVATKDQWFNASLPSDSQIVVTPR